MGRKKKDQPEPEKIEQEPLNSTTKALIAIFDKVDAHKVIEPIKTVVTNVKPVITASYKGINLKTDTWDE